MPIESFNEPHYPSKWSIAVVFAVIILLMLGVFVWAFFINLGTVVVQSDKPFSLEFNGTTELCDDSTCELSLPPGLYDFVARRDAYYDQSFSIEVTRWADVVQELDFELVPFLAGIPSEDLPEDDPSPVRINRQNGTIQFIRDQEGQENVITEFESLSDPIVRTGGSLALIIDEGRLFFVDLESGRKQRRFEEGVDVQDALISDNGKRALLFVDMEGTPFVWVWFNETSEMMPLQWYEPSEFVQWRHQKDYLVYVITSKLQETTNPGLFADILQQANLLDSELALFQYHIDTGEASIVHRFAAEEVPVTFERRGSRYFVEYDDGRVDELVLQ